MNNEKREQFKELLAKSIMDEMEKPVDKIDFEFVNACEILLNELSGSEQLSNEEIEKRINEITGKNAPKTHKLKFFPRRKGLIAASIVAAVFLTGSVTLSASSPFREMILKTLKLEVGESISEGNITFTYMGETKVYEDIDELVNNENLNILYPSELPSGVDMDMILTTDEVKTITITYTDKNIGITIMRDSTVEAIVKGEEYTANGITFNIVTIGKEVYAYALVEQDLYSFRSNSTETLKIMIDSLGKISI